MSSTIKQAIDLLKLRIAYAYAAVANKGGTLPAIQDSANLPSAIESIPSGGGNIIDASYGISFYQKTVGTGFFSESTLPKIIGGKGRKDWSSFFDGYNPTGTTIDGSGFSLNEFPDISEMDTSDGENFTRFYANSRISNNRQLPTIRVTSKCTNIEQMCYSNYCHSIDTSGWDCSGVTNAKNFALYWDCNSIIYGHTIEEVENGLVAMRGLSVSISIGTKSAIPFKDILALANGVADLTGKTSQILTINAVTLSAMTEAQLLRIDEILTSKNWLRA